MKTFWPNVNKGTLLLEELENLQNICKKCS